MSAEADQERCSALFAPDADEHRDRLFEQYRMLVASADAVSDRRHRAHGLFLTINAGVLALFGATVDRYPFYTSAFILLAGVFVATTWAALIERYRLLNSAKFQIIHEVESRLPLRMYTHEWALLKQGDGTVHRPLATAETNIPYIALAVYGVLVVLLLSGALRSPPVPAVPVSNHPAEILVP